LFYLNSRTGCVLYEKRELLEELLQSGTGRQEGSQSATADHEKKPVMEKKGENHV
jgi:hypothetical protein